MKSADEIRRYCEDKMANYKIPETTIFIEKIPRTPTGKILKRDLRQELEALE
jgi:fatty-acyl-CoA synthase